MARVVLENLTKIYPEKSGPGVMAVKGINLEIHDREFMVLVGPSGCGKSTTLRMVAGLEAVSAGTITIEDRMVNEVPPKDRDIAMVFQNYALYPHMSVYENMAFGLVLRKFPKPEIDQRVREAAAMLGLGDLLDRKPKALSGGQRQRVAVGRAIVRKPKVFLFDEPLSNLDAKMRVSTRTEISKLHARLDATMIYVTHDQVEAMTMGDRICVMKDGEIQQVAAPLELYNHPANLFVAGFIGSPPMNLFRGTIRSAGAQLVFEETNLTGSPLMLHLPDALVRQARAHVNQSVVLGIRPEDIHVVGPGGPAPAPVPGQTADVLVEIAEPMGAETYVYLDTRATSFVLRAGPTMHPHPNQSLTVLFDLTKAHLFDAGSEQTLG